MMSADPVNSSDEAVEAALAEAERRIRTFADELRREPDADTPNGLSWINSTLTAAEIVAAYRLSMLEQILRDRAAGSVPVATPEPDDSRITNQAGHEFTFTVELRGEGCNWSSTMVPQTVRAYDLPAAIAELAKVPFPAWFEEESDEVATPKPTVCEFCRRADGGHERSCLTNLPEVPVATPPAEPEPMVGIFDVIAVQQNYRRHLLSLDPSPEVRAALDEAIPAPSQPVTCEHGWTRAHCGTCIDQKNEVGPVSVPKESSE